MANILLTTQIIFAVILTLVVLFQKSSSIGLGSYSGTNESVFGSKGPTNFLSKMTFIVGFLFLSNTIALGYVYNQNTTSTVLDTVSIVPKSEVPTSSIPTPPAIPEAK